MLFKLSFRNAVRSAKDYLLYIVTMSVISALMSAFHGMMFSKDLRAIYNEMQIFMALVLMSSFFVMFIIIWLVNYMVRFMLERRSREFGTYMLLGMKKKQIAGIFWKENLLLGAASLLIGILPGFAFQKIFINIFYAVLDVDYKITADFSILGTLITAGILMVAYLFAFLRIKRRLKKIHINDLMSMEKRNEEVANEKKTWKKIYTFIAVIYIVLFHIMAFNSMMTQLTVWFYILGLIVSIYMLYVGLSSFFIGFISKKRRGVYNKANIFVLRQLSSKLKTMRFTMGTLSIFFTAALLGVTVVMMFGDYQNKELEKQLPFDVLIFSDQSSDDFSEDLRVLQENIKLRDHYIYRIYENGTNAVNDFLYEHRAGTYRTNIFLEDKMGDNSYFGYDTYIRLSDYNRIRGILGMEAVTIAPGNYILHGKTFVENELLQIKETVEVKSGDLQSTLICQEIRQEPISQEGMNGADYIIVVPDEESEAMRPFYSLFAGAFAEGQAVPADLQNRIREVRNYFSEEHYENLYEIEVGVGSSQVLSFADSILVRENAVNNAEVLITALCFILAYLGLVFLCTAMTILTVQQLSDSSKYQFRYRILGQLGLNRHGIHKVVLKQLGAYYVCPFIVSILLSFCIGMFLSERFVYFTGIDAGSFQYYFLSVLIFAVVYVSYFVISFVEFLRNLR